MCSRPPPDLDPDRSYDRFGFYTVMEHGGDFRAAARSLAGQGHGEPQHEPHHQASTTPNEAERPAAPERLWPTLDEAALHGLAGEVVRTIAPHTEGDPVALLVNFLVMFGSATGRSPHARVGAARHHTNLNAVHVGETARARKGTAHSETQRVMALADPDWNARVQGGLSSGEGLIYAVRDPIWKPNNNGEMKLVDPGVEDKRLLAVEAEFSSVLRVAGRDGNTLSELMRLAWDGNDLRTLTRSAPIAATAPHISVLGPHHGARIAPRIDRDLSGERVRQSQPVHLRASLQGVATRRRVVGCRSERARDPRARGSRLRAQNRAVAPRCRDGSGLGECLLGSHRRAPRHVGSDHRTGRGASVAPLAALCTARSVSGDPAYPSRGGACRVAVRGGFSSVHLRGCDRRPVADQILAALRRNGRMTQTQISDLFARNQKAGRLDQALATLLVAGLVRTWQGEADQRPAAGLLGGGYETSFV